MKSKSLKGNAAVAGLIGFAVLAIVVMLILGSFMGVVDTGHRGVVLGNWGAKVTGDVKPEGFYFKKPFTEDVVEMNVQVQKEEAEASAASKDMQDVSTKVAVNYQLNESSVGTIYQDMRKDYVARVITPSIQEVVKASTAQFTAEELITKRSVVKDMMTNQLREKLQPYGITVREVNIVNFGFSESFNAAIEAKVKAEQDALASKNTLEKVKYDAQQAIERARGEGDARVLTAKAEAEAIKIQAEAIQSQGGAEYVNLKAVEAWNGVLPVQMVPGSTVPFINLNR